MRTHKLSTSAAKQVVRKLLPNTLLVFILFLNLGCENNVCPTCSDWDWDNDDNNIHGSGNLVTVERDLPSFHSINHATVGQVNLTYGEAQQVLVNADDNIHMYVKTEVFNGELMISIKSDSGLSNFDLSFDIVIPQIKKLTASSAGNIYGMNKFYGDQVNLVLLSAGNINLEIEANELHSNLSSAGNLFVKGAVNKHTVNLNSAGNLNAFSLFTDTTYITLNSAGNANVKVSEYLDATLSSVGSLYYMGNPVIVQRISSIGRIYNAN